MSSRDSRPTPSELRDALEESEEGEARKIGEPLGRPEPGAIVVGPVNAGPTGERDGGYRQAEPASTILWVAGIVIVILAVGLGYLFFR